MVLVAIHCAIWHPTMPAEEIIASVGLVPEQSGSVGEKNDKNGQIRTRTYCRFLLGQFTQTELYDGIASIKAMYDLSKNPEFSNNGGSLAVYIKNLDNAPDIVIDQNIIGDIFGINAKLVIR